MNNCDGEKRESIRKARSGRWDRLLQESALQD